MRLISLLLQYSSSKVCTGEREKMHASYCSYEMNAVLSKKEAKAAAKR